MDGDPAVEPELDSFSLTLPLPYRVAVIIVAAVWAWGVNLHLLSLFKIDVLGLIRYQRPNQNLPPHYFSTYRLASFLSITVSISLALFWILSHRSPSLVNYYDFIPITTLLAIALLFFVPFSHKRIHISTNGRYRFLSTLKRVSTGYIAQTADGKFGDILLADVLTSYAKVIADLFVALCMFFTPSGSATARPNRSCGGEIVVPLIIAIPYLIRFRQCVIEYIRVKRSNRRSGGIGDSGWGGQHLANAAKYASAFPVIIFSSLQRSMTHDQTYMGLSEIGIYRAWVVAVMINSIYSFYWDVQKDWDLTLLSPEKERSSPEHPYGLRRMLVFPQNSLYYGAIFLDLILRFTWSLKLSTHLDHFNDWEGGIFVLEVAEVFRRWIWIFFRVETEWVRNQNSGSLGQDDILLGDWSGRDDY